MSQRTEIESLVSLLEDPDPYVQGKVKKRLFELGERAVPLLDEQKSKVRDEQERARIHNIIRDITSGSIEHDFIDILEGGLNNRKQLERAVLMLSRFENPTLRLKKYEQELDYFADSIRDAVRFEPDETKQMHAVLHHIFGTLEFSGGTTDYYDIKNAYLDRVIDGRRGLPLSLAFVLLFVSRRLDLPFYGINMPIHFLLKFKGKREELLIDPFDHGKTITYNQCYYFLKQNGVEPQPAHFETAGEATMLARMIGNLMQSYRRAEQPHKADDLQELLQTLKIMCL